MPAGAEFMRVNTGVIATEYRAYAKVNLILAVGARRPDGYHDLATVMVPVTLSDLVSVGLEPRPCAGEPEANAFPPVGDRQFSQEALPIRLSCPGLPDVPPHKNLAYRAAAAFLEKTGVRPGVSIVVEKRIPWGAGMGGGSSDAAAVLSALNSLLAPEHALRPDELVSLAASIGADVPFLVGCNSRPPLWEGALCVGIGEKVTPVHVPNMWLVIAFPNAPVQTGQVYALLDDIRQAESDFPCVSPGAVKGSEPGEPSQDDRVRGFLDALSSGDTAEIGRGLFNDLEEAAMRLNPEIARLKRMFYECGALGALMTGSGSAVYGIAPSEAGAREMRLRLGQMVAGSELEVRDIIVARTGVEQNGC